MRREGKQQGEETKQKESEVRGSRPPAPQSWSFSGQPRHQSLPKVLGTALVLQRLRYARLGDPAI